MPDHSPVVVHGAVEGLLDEAVLRRLVHMTGGVPGSVYGKNGKVHLLEKLTGYNQAARFSPCPWLVLVDLDQSYMCAPPARARWLAGSARRMCLRIAVHEIEAWLLADRDGISKFLAVRNSLIPENPEAELDPKRTMVEIASYSRRSEIREDMVPRPGSGRSVGPAYPSRLIEFVERSWRPDNASHRADSLRRCLERLGELVKECSRQDTQCP